MSFDIMRNNDRWMFSAAVLMLILVLVIYNIELQNANAGEDENQFDPFAQSGDFTNGQNQQDGDQFGPNIQSQREGQQIPSQPQEGFNKMGGNPQHLRLYDNPLYSMKVPYPSNWIVDDTEDHKVLFAPQIEQKPSIEITILPNPKADASISMIENIKQLMTKAGDTIVEEDQSTINGRTAYYVSWSGNTDSGNTFKNAAIVTQTQDFLYIFQLSSTVKGFENDLSFLNAMFLDAKFSESSGMFASQNPSGSVGVEQEHSHSDVSRQTIYEQASQPQKFEVPVLTDIIVPISSSSENWLLKQCITTQLSISGKERQFCSNLELDTSNRSLGQNYYTTQLQTNLTNMDEELIKYIQMEVCININPPSAQSTFRGIEECNAAFYDINQKAFVTRINFPFQEG